MASKAINLASDEEEEDTNDKIHVPQDESKLTLKINLLSKEISRLTRLREQLIDTRNGVRENSRKRKRRRSERENNVVAQDWKDREFVELPHLHEVLKNRFDMTAFRGRQLEVLQAIFAKQDVFCVLPTGGGKSLCYQLPAVVQGGWTVVISPLLSLSHDQVQAARRFGIDAMMLSSGIDKAETKAVYNRLYEAIKQQQSSSDGDSFMLFITPEMVVRNKKLLGQLEKLDERGILRRVVIDEAHCCSTMGHSFRPEFQNLFILRQQLPQTQLVCCTATATQAVERDVLEILLGKGGSCVTVRDSFNRPNLEFRVEPRPRADKQAMAHLAALVSVRFWVGGRPTVGIVYCPTRRTCELVAKALNAALAPGHGGSMLAQVALPYHAHMDPEDKAHVHGLWKSGKVPVICATSAFGMGIDLAGVRFVIHFTIPPTMEAYCQEAGRAGRDGEGATCILLYSPFEIPQTSRLVCEVRNGKEKLLDIVRYCEKESSCRRESLARAFGEPYSPAMCPSKCDVCCNDSGEKREVLDRTPEALFVLDCLEDALQSSAEDGSEGRVTMIQLISGLMNRGNLKSAVSRVMKKRNHGQTGQMQSPLLPDFQTEDSLAKLVAQLLMDDFLDFVWVHTAYSTNTYLVPGSLSFALREGAMDFTF